MSPSGLYDRDDISALASIHVHERLKSHFLDDKYADLTIRCGGQEFKAHRVIVCPQPPFFERACDGHFKESTAGVIKLPEDHPDILFLFLEFLYTGNYEDEERPTFGNVTNVVHWTADRVIEQLGRVHKTITRDVGQRYWLRTPKHMQDAFGTFFSPVRDVTPYFHNIVPGIYGDDDDYVLYSDEDEITGLQKEAVRTEREQREERIKKRGLSLLTSLRVYVMADKYNVPHLKLLARQRFFITMREAFDTYPYMAAVVDELYETTAPDDFIIREIPCHLIATAYDWDHEIISDDLERLIARNAELAAGFLKYRRFYESGSLER